MAAQIPRMQLQRRLVVLPFPERANGLAQPVDSRLAQNNRHSPESHTTAPTARTRFSRPAGTAGPAELSWQSLAPAVLKG